MSEPDIAKLRAFIDAVDDKIIALLNERSGFVRQVGMTKKKRQQDGQAFIRSGREAEMVRRIYAHFEAGAFPAAAGAQIWRTIIAASLSLESPLTVTAHAPEGDHEIYWLAREYFGNFIPVTRQPTPRRVLGDILDGKAEVGVLPMPAENTHEGAWWAEMPETISIFACVPFLMPRGAEVKALAVANVKPEPTGNDVSFIKLKTDMDVSQSRLKTLFDKHKLTVRWLAIETSAAHRTHLIEVKGFVMAEDESIKALKAEIGASLLALSSLGAYAVPIAL